MNIEFVTEGVEMPSLDFPRIEAWIAAVAKEHCRTVGTLCYCFCNDPYIIKVNREFLQHDFYTDIITFDNTVGNRIAGDILISLDTVATNAVAVGTDYDTELLRVVIHGILHLCGIDDKGPGEREIMESHENRALELYREIDGLQ